MNVSFYSTLATEEYPPESERYIELLDRQGSILEQLNRNAVMTTSTLSIVPERICELPFSTGKWSIKDTLCHLIDDERIYVYRALRFARGDKTVLPGFDQDQFASAARANERSMEGLLDEFKIVRRATLAFFNCIDEVASRREGFAEGKKFSVRALAFHIAGHELHHLQIIRKFLENRESGHKPPIS